MPMFRIPKFFDADGIPLVSIDPATPTIGEVTFYVGNEQHTYHLSREKLERLARDIDVKLKAARLPARGQSSAGARSPNDK